MIHEHLDWAQHIATICLKISKSIGIINKIKTLVSARIRRNLYCTLILPYLQYCNIVWASTFPTKLERLHKLQKRVVRLIANAHYLAPSKKYFSIKFNTLTVYDINKLQIATFVYSCLQNSSNSSNSIFNNFFIRNNQIHIYQTRNASKIHFPKVRTTARMFSIYFRGGQIWNNLPTSITTINSLHQFKIAYKKLLISSYSK